MTDSPYLENLNPDFLAKARILLTNCAMAGVVVRVVCGLRTPIEQAKLWRQGRDIDTIGGQIISLRNKGCKYLASCLDAAGPQDGPLVTSAIPGLSWHNWGMAMDVMTFDSVGKPINDGNDPSYANFQEQVTLSGLYPYGSNWKVDAGHVQFYQKSPLQLYSLQKIDAILSAQYPLAPMQPIA